MALGQAIVRELEMEARGSVIERWLAHHLAELISVAAGATGHQKEKAERKAVDAILKLWMHRRALPSPVDPLGGYRDAIAVLGRLVPDADPWRRYRNHQNYEGLLQEMFETLVRSVVGGILLTHAGNVRSISEEEVTALEEEEAYLKAELDKWMRFLPKRPPAEVTIAEGDSQSQPGIRSGEANHEPDGHTPEQEAIELEVDVHSAIAAQLERMQENLGDLLIRWKASALESLKESCENDDTVADDHRREG